MIFMKPNRNNFTKNEWQIIKKHRTPLQVQLFLNSLRYNTEKNGETLRSFREVVKHKTAHCLEAALTAAVILEQHGYPIMFLDMESKDNLDHVVFLYKRKDMWGAVGKSREPGLHGRRPVFKTLRRLVDSYFDPFIDLQGRIVRYGVGTLKELGQYNWRLSTRNIWKAERYFIEMPHKPFRSSNRRYRYWLERYKAFIKKHPGKRPVYYNLRSTWTPI